MYVFLPHKVLHVIKNYMKPLVIPKTKNTNMRKKPIILEFNKVGQHETHLEMSNKHNLSIIEGILHQFTEKFPVETLNDEKLLKKLVCINDGIFDTYTFNKHAYICNLNTESWGFLETKHILVIYIFIDEFKYLNMCHKKSKSIKHLDVDRFSVPQCNLVNVEKIGKEFKAHSFGLLYKYGNCKKENSIDLVFFNEQNFAILKFSFKVYSKNMLYAKKYFNNF